jgi:hypothetical protein
LHCVGHEDSCRYTDDDLVEGHRHGYLGHTGSLGLEGGQCS